MLLGLRAKSSFWMSYRGGGDFSPRERALPPVLLFGMEELGPSGVLLGWCVGVLGGWILLLVVVGVLVAPAEEAAEEALLRRLGLRRVGDVGGGVAVRVGGGARRGRRSGGGDRRSGGRRLRVGVDAEELLDEVLRALAQLAAGVLRGGAVEEGEGV